MSIEDVKATPIKHSTEDVLPIVNVVSPTPLKHGSYTSSSTPTTGGSIKCLGISNASHRVLYRGSLCFLNGETDVSLEGVCFIAHYAPSATSSLMTSPLALALESQRGRLALNISSVVPLSSIEDRLDSSIDVRVYIHPQSLIARAYFEGIFCTEPLSGNDKRTSHCVRVRLDDIGEESDGIVIYAELNTNHSNDTNSCINYTDTPRTLHIRAARLLPIPCTAQQTKRRPRPDDPLPRNPLLSVAPLSKSNPFAKRRREVSTASLGLASSDRARKMARIGSTSSAKSDVFLEPLPPESKIPQTLSRAKSLQSMNIGNTSYLDRPGMKDLKRSKSDGQDQVKDLYDVFGTMDALRASVSNRSAHHETSDGGCRAMPPSPKFVPPTSKPLVTVTPEEENLIRTNKETIKKAVVSGMTIMGVTKAHVDFKEIYQCTTRGIALAFRHKMQIQRVEREEVRPYVHNHLEMYIGNMIQDMK